MPEFIRTAEVMGDILGKAYNVGKFVLEHLKGGAFGDLAEDIKPAKIIYHPERGEE
jgi:hypothetical protein